MSDKFSRRALLSGCSALAASALTTSCGKSAGQFLGSPLEYDRKWFFVPDVPTLFDAMRSMVKLPEKQQDATKLRLPFGAIDAAGNNVLPFSEGFSIPFKELMGLGAFGIAFDPKSLLLPSRKSEFLMQATFGDQQELSKKEFSRKGNAVVDFVAGKVIADRQVLPMGAEVGGLAPALDAATKTWGYMDASGTFQIKPHYSSAAAFHGGFARVGNPQRQIGLIDPQGKLKVTLGYGKLSRTANGMSSFKVGDAVGVVNTTNTEHRAIGAYDIFFEGGDYSLVTANPRQFLLLSNKDGKFVKLPANIAEAMMTTTGAVVRDGRGKPWRLIDGQANPIGSGTYPDVLQSYGGVLQASNADSVGLLDAMGKWIVEPRYSYLLDFEFGWAYYRKAKANVGGMVSVKGKEILDGKLAAARCLGQVIIAVEDLGGEKYQMAYFNTDGKRLKTLPQVDTSKG